MKPPGPEAPVVLVKWYDCVEWDLECVNLSEEKQNKEFRAVVLTVPSAARISLIVEIRP